MASIRPLQEDAQVRQLPTPYAEGGISPQALGGGAGNNAERAAQIVDAAVKKGKDDGDTVAMIAAMGLAQDAYNAQVLDGKTGYASLRGEQAIAARDDVVKSYDKVLEKIAAGLSTPEQKAAFGKFSLTMQERARNKIEEHSRHETEVFSVTKYEGTQQSYRRVLAQPGVVNNAGERDRYVDELSRVAYAEARRRGEDPQLLVGQAQDRAVRTVLDNLLAGKNPNIVEAAQVLGKYGDRLGDDRAKYQKALSEHADTQGGISDGLRLVQKWRTPGTQFVDEDQAKAEANKLNVNPERKLKTIELIEHEASAGRVAQTQKNASVFARAMAVYENTGTLAPADPQAAAIIADAKLYLLDPANQATGLWEHIKDRARVDAKRDLTDPPTSEERDAARQIRWEMSQDQFRAKYLRMTPEALQADATFQAAHPKDQAAIYTQFVKLQESTRGAAAQAAKVVPDPITSMLVRMGRGGPFPKGSQPPNKWSQEQKDLYDAAYKGVADQAGEFVATTGKQPGYADYEKFIEYEFQKGVVVGGGRFFGDAEVSRLEAQTNARYQGKEFQPGTAVKAAGMVVRPPPTAGRVRMVGPDGRAFTLPAAQVDDFLKSPDGKGFRRE